MKRIPTLDQLKSDFFSLDSRVFQALEDGRLSPELAQKVKDDDEYLNYKNENIEYEPEEMHGEEIEDIQTPKWFKEKFDALKELDEKFGDIKKYESGHIVKISEIQSILTPDSGTSSFMNRPIYVLLNEQTSGYSSVWSGWVVASEIDYAAWWDVIMDEDAEAHPDAAMIQIWNAVHIYQGSIDTVVGKISTDKLPAIRSLERDYLLTVSTKNLLFSMIEDSLDGNNSNQNLFNNLKFKKELTEAVELINFYGDDPEKLIEENVDTFNRTLLQEGISASVEKIISSLFGFDLFNKIFRFGTHISSEGFEFLTGLPYEEEDERLEYQAIYLRAAGILKEPVLEIQDAKREVDQKALTSQWGKAFLEGIEAIKNTLTVIVQPDVALAMSGNDDESVKEGDQSHFIFENCIKISKRALDTYVVEVQNGRYPEINIRLITSEGVMENRDLIYDNKNKRDYEFKVNLRDTETKLEFKFPEREPIEINLV